MTDKGKEIHALWYVMVAMFVVLDKMTREKAQKEAYKIIKEKYGEEHPEERI